MKKIAGLLQSTSSLDKLSQRTTAIAGSVIIITLFSGCMLGRTSRLRQVLTQKATRPVNRQIALPQHLRRQVQLRL